MSGAAAGRAGRSAAWPCAPVVVTHNWGSPRLVCVLCTLYTHFYTVAHSPSTQRHQTVRAVSTSSITHTRTFAAKCLQSLTCEMDAEPMGSCRSIQSNTSFKSSMPSSAHTTCRTHNRHHRQPTHQTDRQGDGKRATDCAGCVMCGQAGDARRAQHMPCMPAALLCALVPFPCNPDLLGACW